MHLRLMSWSMWSSHCKVVAFSFALRAATVSACRVQNVAYQTPGQDYMFLYHTSAFGQTRELQGSYNLNSLNGAKKGVI